MSPPPAPAARARAESPVIVPREEAVSLAEIVTAQVRIESYEAVAIVQALCTLVLESRMPIGRPTADLSRIRISPNGTVSTVSAGRHNPSAAIQYLGDVLSKTLPAKDFMFLRERVVEKTTSSPPHYSSVEELSDTLAYYERPDRAAQIQEVYSRWETRPALPAPSPPMYERLLGPAAASAITFWTRHARSSALGLIGLAVVLVVGFLGLRGRGPGSSQAPPRQAPAGSAVSNPQRPRALDSPVGRIAPPAAVVERPPSRQPESAPTVPTKPELPTSVAASRIPAPPGRGAERAPSRRPEPAPTVPTKPRGLPTGVAASRIPPTAPGVDRAPSRQPELVPTVPVPKKPRELPARVAENHPPSPAPVEPEGRRPTAAVTPPSIIELPPPMPKAPERRAEDALAEGTTRTVIYSIRNADVIPPAMLFSQLPGPSPLASPQHDVPALEIVVNERGTVDVVRYVVRPRNIAESVVITNGLSAAKAWRFRPALKDGHPVPYRLLVALSND